MQVVQTAEEPPNRGSSILATIGWNENRSDELTRKTVQKQTNSARVDKLPSVAHGCVAVAEARRNFHVLGGKPPRALSYERWSTTLSLWFAILASLD